jgi:hypothetical protein
VEVIAVRRYRGRETGRRPGAGVPPGVAGRAAALEVRAMLVPPNFPGVKIQYGDFSTTEASDLKGKALKGFRIQSAWKLYLRMCK